MQMSISSKRLSRLLILTLLFCSGVITYAGDLVRSEKGMVVSASSLASKVGLQILKKGGNAVDAAVAVGFALSVTYPVAGNLGGGGFMVIHTADGKTYSIDYREKAPMKAFRDMFLDADGNYVEESSTEGINSSGVPGSVAGMLYALEKYGTMKLSEVIQPAINLAEDGFPLDYHTAASFNSNYDAFARYPSSKRIFTKEDGSFKPGYIFKQSDLAGTLKRILSDGKKGFYEGQTADMIVRQFRDMGGLVTEEDLKSYEPVERTPLTGYYRGYKVISMGPPSSGGTALLQLLNIMENKQFSKDEWGSSSYIHYLAEAMKFVYADRAKYLGDPDFTEVPLEKLLSKEYARELFELIKDYSIPSDSILSGGLLLSESTETTHYSVYDANGNSVSVTTTLNSGYGSNIVVDGAGFLLNNEMDDFSIKAGVPNQFGLLGSEANSVQPGKRMLSSMTPTIILKEDKPLLILGSPGGSTIITVVLQVIMNIIDFEMNLSQAIRANRIHHQWFPDQIDYEKLGLTLDVRNNLREMGYQIGNERSLGLVEGILIDSVNNIIYGVSDPRGNGSAEGY
jgi:gamma-glutamyltranspeptidase / glutathione hydrolase